MSDNEACLLKCPTPHALKQGQADRGEAPAATKARLVDPNSLGIGRRTRDLAMFNLAACAASIPRQLQPPHRMGAGRWHSFGGSLSCARRRPFVMRYVERILQPGEQIRHISSIHWVVYWAGVGVTLLAAVAYWLSETRPLTRLWLYTACALALVAVVLLVQEWFTWWVTEIAVTNRRVIYKKGFIRRRTNEMNMDKVESVQVDQSILGRMLNYGTVTILGTGEGFETLRTIADPIKLRNCITGT
jgi:hypothetical protein